MCDIKEHLINEFRYIRDKAESLAELIDGAVTMYSTEGNDKYQLQNLYNEAMALLIECDYRLEKAQKGKAIDGDKSL